MKMNAAASFSVAVVGPFLLFYLKWGLEHLFFRSILQEVTLCFQHPKRRLEIKFILNTRVKYTNMFHFVKELE